MTKRKATEQSDTANKRPATASNGRVVYHRFNEEIFKPETVQKYTTAYAASEPYRHAVVSNLIDDDLLRAVRSEIVDNIHFTPKETDIYKIHQSGDLANLDGLPASALEKLPSLLQLRDALYSSEVRGWLSQVTGAGALSGQKTDMAVNVYVPGCHLLCHDDVIGSRRVSYILYLTNPEFPWQAEWGGALRLYPTENVQTKCDKPIKLPSSEWTKVIPPAWNQLSFFAVQPGESFHDVEEVYKRSGEESSEDGGRVRMAISGWFHIPQEGEEGYEAGLEEKLAERSSLQQLQGSADQFDEPQLRWHNPDLISDNNGDHETEQESEMTQADLDFLLNFITPNYLTPDTVEELNEMFAESSTLQLANFLNAKFAARLRELLEDMETNNAKTNFAISRPPHKHRYQYIHAEPIPTLNVAQSDDPLDAVLNRLLPSRSFKKWLSLATGLTLERASILARRFRRGLDYQLAQGYRGDDPQLEYCLCVTPTKGWGAEEEEDQEDSTNGHSSNRDKGKGKEIENGGAGDKDGEDNVGGYELYMAGDDDEDDEDGEGSNDGVEVPSKMQSHTGAGDRRNAKRKKADPAVYKAAEDDEDDGILLSLPAGWNTLSVTLRDQGTLKFVKYVSQSALGDRFDFVGCVEVEPDDDMVRDSDEDEDDGGEG